jgi:hypothetical protein
LIANITNEISRATLVENQIVSDLSSANTVRLNADIALGESLNTEISDRIAADSALNDIIVANRSFSSTADFKNANFITIEKDRALEAEAFIRLTASTEKTRVDSTMTFLSGVITVERDNRIAAVSNLQGQLNSDVVDLQGKLDAGVFKKIIPAPSQNFVVGDGNDRFIGAVDNRWHNVFAEEVNLPTYNIVNTTDDGADRLHFNHRNLYDVDVLNSYENPQNNTRDVKYSIVPMDYGTHDLGKSDKRFRNLHCQNIVLTNGANLEAELMDIYQRLANLGG